MAAVLAKGETVIENAAREPEVADLAKLPQRRWAPRSSGIGSSTLQVQGVTSLHGAEHTVLPDRIETGTYAMAAAMTGGEVILQGTRADLLESALALLRSSGVEIEETPSGLRVARNGGGLRSGRRRHRALPGVPHRPAGAAHGADVHGARAPRPYARRSSRTASCMCRSLRGSAPASISRATRPW